MKTLYKIKVLLLILLAIIITSALTIILLPAGPFRTILNIFIGAIIGIISQYFLYKE